MSIYLWMAIAGLGGIGAAGRFLLDAAISSRAGGSFPVGTLAVNLSGAFLLGLLLGASLGGSAYTLAGSATLGSFTTFSTWMLETQRLGEDGESRSLAANLLVSIAFGLAAAAIGRAIGESL